MFPGFQLQFQIVPTQPCVIIERRPNNTWAASLKRCPFASKNFLNLSTFLILSPFKISPRPSKYFNLRTSSVTSANVQLPSFGSGAPPIKPPIYGATCYNGGLGGSYQQGGDVLPLYGSGHYTWQNVHRVGGFGRNLSALSFQYTYTQVGA